MNGVVTRLATFNALDEPGVGFGINTHGDQDDYYVVHVWADPAVATFGIAIKGAPSTSANGITLATITQAQLDANRSAAVLIPAWPRIDAVLNGATGTKNMIVNLME